MKTEIFVPYLLIMALVTYAVRAVPFLLMQKKIKNRFLNALFEYIPYTVLTAMTVPSVFYAAGSPVSAGVGFICAVITAYIGKGLMTVATAACIGVMVCEFALSI